MYKNRFYFWIAIFLVAMLIKSIINLDISTLVVKNKEITINIDADSSVKSTFTSAYTGSIELIQTTNNPSIVVKPVSNEELKGYDKISNAIYSPIILCIPTDETSPSSLFYKLGGNASYVNFVGLADAIINDETIEDLNFSEITLYLPSKSTVYYDKVVEQMYVALNNNKIPTEEEKLQLKEKIDILLEKSKECNDINAKLEEGIKGYNIFIMPEYYMNQSSTYGERKGYGYYRPVYFEKTVICSYDAFVKTDEMYGDVTLKDVFSQQILKNENFISSSKYRTSEYTKYDSLFYGYVPENLDYIH